MLPPERIWILTNDHLRDEIVRQLPEVPKRQILAEPAQRNTAPCIGLAAHILQRPRSRLRDGCVSRGPHHPEARQVLRLVRQAFKAADAGKIAVLGIQPRWAETGYGYIEFPEGTRRRRHGRRRCGVFARSRTLATAKRFVEAGNFYWNAGMFFWRTDVLLDALRHHLPKTITLLAALPPSRAGNSGHAWPRAIRSARTSASTTRVMERAANVIGIPAGDIGWNDVGSWNAVYELLPRDRNGNARSADSLIESSTGNYVDAHGKLVALLGVKDLVVVDTPDALLIADRHRAQEVGSLVKTARKARPHDLL